MSPLAISLFEFGQFLRILLWIALPMVMLSILVTVYVHHRRRSKQKSMQDPAISISSGDDDFPEVLAKLHPTAQELAAEGETVYQGLLWMKNKYEQDREQSTTRYMQLKEEHGQLKDKYMELETRHLYTQALLNERQTTIDRLREQLEQEILRTAEAKTKLESSGHLLLKIHKELDQVLAGDAPLARAALLAGEIGEIAPDKDDIARDHGDSDEKVMYPDNRVAEVELMAHN